VDLDPELPGNQEVWTMRTRLCAAVTVVTAALALALSTGVPPAAAHARAKASEAVPAKKKKPKATTTTTKAAKSAAMPSDACKLLTLQEVTPLVTGSSPGSPVTSSGQTNQVMCRWDTPDTLQDVVLTVTNMPSSVPVSDLKLALTSEAHDPGNKAVSGLGDVALVSSVIPPNAEVKVLLGHLLLDVEYSSDDPLGSTRQDDVVALAKLAFGRL
jgi:hypothetical protein